MAKSSIKIDLNFPILKLQGELLKIANNIVIRDLQTRMQKGVDIDNDKYDSLAQSTKKNKNRARHGFTPLLATKQLQRSFKAKNFKRNSVRIVPTGTRREGGISNKRLGEYLQIDGVRSKAFGRRIFNFFGISKEAERDAIRFMEIAINKAIKSGGRRIIRRV